MKKVLLNMIMIIFAGIILINFVDASPFNFTDRLNAYYTFTNVINNNLIIDENKTNNATINLSAISFQTGKLGDGIYYNGSSYGYMNLTLLPASGVTQDMSFMVWVKTNQTPEHSRGILGLGHPNSDQHIDFSFAKDYNLSISANNNVDIGSFEIVSNTTISDNNWHLVGFTLESQYIKIYVDGILTGNGTLDDSTPGSYSNNFKFIGNRPTSYTNRTWNGSIDEVGIWNRIINNSEVIQLYNSGSGVPFNQIVINSENYTSPSPEGIPTSFSINTTINSGISSYTGTFWYNDSAYVGTRQTIGNNEIFSYILNTPKVDSQQNLSFKWALELIDDSSQKTLQNSTLRNQTINNIGIDNCTDNSILILNYTLKDEKDLTVLSGVAANATVELNVDISPLGSITPIIQYNKSYNQTNPIQVCIAADILNTTYFRLDAITRYYAKNYVTEYRYIDNLTITNNNTPHNFDLLDLLTVESQEFLITYRDSNFIPQSNMLINIYRQYPAENLFRIVETPRTDSDGRTIGHFVLNDVVYIINITKDGKLFSTFNNIRVYCASAVNDCRLVLDARSILPSFSNRKNDKNISYSTTYNSTSRLYQFSFAAVDGISKKVNLTITRFDSDGNLTLCSQQISSTQATLSCTLSATYANSTGTAKVTVNNELLYTDIFQIGEPAAGITAVRFLLAAGLILLLALIGYSSGPAIIMLFIVGLVGAGLLALLDWGGYIGPSSALIWIIIAALILLAKVAKEKKDG